MSSASDSERKTRIKELVDRIVDLPAQEREARINELSRGDEALEKCIRDEVEHHVKLLLKSASVPVAHTRTDDSSGTAEVCADPLLESVPELEGYRVLDPCVLYAKLGQGGMGAVYRGRHLTLGIDVAVKCVLPRLVADDPQFLERFQREAQLAARLNHPNLCRVIPVLLPGATRGDRSRLPPSLSLATWVEFKSLRDEGSFRSLVAGIRKQEVRPKPAYEGVCPYRGLEFFAEGDAEFFFGREVVVDWLLEELKPRDRPEEANRFVAIIGPSGSGKSSLARAGLIPALKSGKTIAGSEEWLYATLRPGAEPLESLALALAGAGIIESSAARVIAARKTLGDDPRALHLEARIALKDGAPARRLSSTSSRSSSPCARTKGLAALSSRISWRRAAPPGGRPWSS